MPIPNDLVLASVKNEEELKLKQEKSGSDSVSESTGRSVGE